MNFTNFTGTTNTSVDPSSPSTNNDHSFTADGILKACIVALLIFAAVSGNLIVCISFIMFRNLRSMTNYFLVSLSISDILVATCVMPVYLLYELHYPQPYFADKKPLLTFWNIMDLFFSMTSVCTLATIAVERNLAISQPFYYTKWISPIRVYITIAVVWMFALTVSVMTQLNPFGEKSHLSVFLVSTSYFLPLVIILIMYTQIWLFARRQARRLRQDGALATDFKAIITIAFVIGSFFVCYTPNMILIIWFHFKVKPFPPDCVVTFTKMLMYFNCCVNPIIYSCFNKTYRAGFKRLFGTVATNFHELRRRVGDKKAQRMQRSRLSLNVTMRSSAGSLLDGPKLSSANSQVRKSMQFRSAGPSVSQNVANNVDERDHPSNNQDEKVVGEPDENIVQDTQQ